MGRDQRGHAARAASLLGAVDAGLGEAIALARWMAANPELSLEEFETSRRYVEYLRRARLRGGPQRGGPGDGLRGDPRLVGGEAARGAAGGDGCASRGRPCLRPQSLGARQPAGRGGPGVGGAPGGARGGRGGLPRRGDRCRQAATGGGRGLRRSGCRPDGPRVGHAPGPSPVPGQSEVRVHLPRTSGPRGGLSRARCERARRGDSALQWRRPASPAAPGLGQGPRHHQRRGEGAEPDSGARPGPVLDSRPRRRDPRRRGRTRRGLCGRGRCRHRDPAREPHPRDLLASHAAEPAAWRRPTGASSSFSASPRHPTRPIVASAPATSATSRGWFRPSIRIFPSARLSSSTPGSSRRRPRAPRERGDSPRRPARWRSRCSS